jgi:hypothetical protein
MGKVFALEPLGKHNRLIKLQKYIIFLASRSRSKLFKTLTF